MDAVLPLIAKTCAFHQAADPQKYPFLPEPEKRYGGWLKRSIGDPNMVFLVGAEDERIVAFLVATIDDEIPIYQVKRYGFVQDVFVDEAYRHRGIAKALMLEAMSRLAAMGIKQVRLDVLERNEPARRLFASCGFRTSIVEMIREI